VSPPGTGSSPSAAASGALRRGAALLSILILAAIAAPHLTHLALAADPSWINDDVRGWLTALYVWPGASGGAIDPQVDYYQAITPIGFQAFYGALRPLEAPVRASRWLPYLLLALFLAALGFSASRLAGWPGAVASLALALSSPSLLARMTGGLPRSFAFPLVGLALVACVRGRPAWLAVATVAGALLYPSVGATLGIALALWLFVLPADVRGRAGSLSRRVALVAVAAALAGLCLAPTLAASRKWGPRIDWNDTARFPELGADGRYGAPDRAPPGLLHDAGAAALTTVEPHGGGLLRALGAAPPDAGVKLAGAVLLLGVAAFARRAAATAQRAPLLRLGALAAAVPLAYGLCLLAAPHLFLPQRVTEFAVPPLVFLMLGVATSLRPPAQPAPLAALLAVAIWLGLFGWGIAGTEGYTVHFKDRPLYRALRAAPDTTLVAGFPDGPIEQVPLFCGRRALYTRETHHVFHERYALEMRARLTALSAALFGDDPAAIAELRTRYGVDLLLVDRAHFRSPPAYFAPYTEIVASDWRRGASGGFALERLLADAEVVRDGRFSIVDLSGLGPAAGMPPAPTPSDGEVR